MKIRIIKDCENGLKIGDTRENVDSALGNELIRLKIAEEVKATRKPSTKKEK